jgi:CO/xanthine dehydrogenase FAD-binding subunit
MISKRNGGFVLREVSYFAPTELDEALKLLAEYGEKVTVMAGGTDLIPKLNHYELKPEVIVYTGGLGLSFINDEGEKLVIGSATTTAMLAKSEIVEKKLGALAEAARLSGSIAISNSATIGGNIVNASPAADLVSPLLAMDAQVKLVKAGSERIVPLEDFITGPGQTVRQQDELLTEIHVPVPNGTTVFLKLGRRKAQTLSIANVAIQFSLEGGECKDARIILGAMSPTHVRCIKAESLLRSCALPLAIEHFGQRKEASKTLDEATIAQCANQAVEETSPIDDQRATAWYRKRAAKALVVKALTQLSQI